MLTGCCEVESAAWSQRPSRVGQKSGRVGQGFSVLPKNGQATAKELAQHEHARALAQHEHGAKELAQHEHARALAQHEHGAKELAQHEHARALAQHEHGAKELAQHEHGAKELAQHEHGAKELAQHEHARALAQHEHGAKELAQHEHGAKELAQHEHMQKSWRSMNICKRAWPKESMCSVPNGTLKRGLNLCVQAESYHLLSALECTQCTKQFTQSRKLTESVWSPGQQEHAAHDESKGGGSWRQRSSCRGVWSVGKQARGRVPLGCRPSWQHQRNTLQCT